MTKIFSLLALSSKKKQTTKQKIKTKQKKILVLVFKGYS